jgi:hypothetical protein
MLLLFSFGDCLALKAIVASASLARSLECVSLLFFLGISQDAPYFKGSVHVPVCAAKIKHRPLRARALFVVVVVCVNSRLGVLFIDLGWTSNVLTIRV